MLSCQYRHFNPRSDERSDGDLLVIDAFVNEFQSTLRRTERPVWHPAPPSCLIFQSTLRRTERPLCFLNLLVQILFQSTLRRTERPIVSGYAKKLGIFQSTLRRTERRHARTLLTCLFYNFNPRSDERSDIIYSYINNCFSYFNPRSDERSDALYIQLSPDRRLFQSTLRRTERHGIWSYFIRKWHFNPRSDERSDAVSSRREVQLKISIHAPTNGATHWQIVDLSTSQFQSTLRRTERLHIGSGIFQPVYFNPRSDERSDTIIFA